jgi:hypothetical protein
MAQQPVRVADLPASTLTGPGAGVTLYCRKCREHFSATRGDYFMEDQETVMRHCGRPMVLARKVSVVDVLDVGAFRKARREQECPSA